MKQLVLWCVLASLFIMAGPNGFCQIYINELMAGDSNALLDEDGDRSDWIEIWNDGSTAVSLTGFSLTDDPRDLQKWVFPSTRLLAGEYLIVFASGKDRRLSGAELHANFNLDQQGEYLGLFNRDGEVVHEYVPVYPSQDVWRGNATYGRDADGNRRYFTEATPGAANGDGVIGFLEPVRFSMKRGFYDEPISVTLLAQPETRIYYTTDGSTPGPETGSLYAGAIPIDSQTMLRASAFRDGWHPGDPVTHTYLFLDDVLRQTMPEGYPSRWGNNVTADYDMDPDVVNHPDYRNTIRDDLQSIPSMSIVTDVEHLFDRRRGIYMFPEAKGIAWERPASVEWIDPEGRAEFQVNCGLRIQGGYSRLPDRRKHSFRMLFKRDYGPPTLRFPVFPHSRVDRFNTLVLRGTYNYSWHSQEGGFGSNIGKAEYMRDEFSRLTQHDMGQPASHGTYVHLYLNGMYWGLYNLCERPDDAFSAEHLGGEKEEWDVITGGTRGVNENQVKAGNDDGWEEALDRTRRREYRTPEQYAEFQELINLDNLIDYMLGIYFTGNRDAPTVIGGGGRPWNYYSSYRRTADEGFHFYMWDSEWSLEETSVNVIEFHNGWDNPAMIFQALRRDLPDFRMRVADRVQKHFFNGGALSKEKAVERYQSLADTIDRAIVGESARWGDLRFNQPRMRDPHWTDERDRILNYLDVRPAIVLNQLRTAGLFPEISAPKFSHRGGEVDPGLELSLTARSQQQFISERVVDIESTWKYEQSGSNLGTAWREPGYDDSSWPSGPALLYVESSDLNGPKNTPLILGETTYYFRHRFELDPRIDPSDIQAELRIMVDDGAVVHINGQEAFRVGVPAGELAYNEFANRTVSNAAWEGAFSFDASLLQPGENVIAVEVHQTNATSSDIVFGLIVDMLLPNPDSGQSVPVYYTIDGSDPRLPGGALSSAARLYDGPIAIDESLRVMARAKEGDVWSAIDQASFFVRRGEGMAAFIREHLKITEVMFNPPEGSGFEFIELFNAHEVESIPLGGLAFVDGVQYAFEPNAILPPQSYALLTPSFNDEERDAFRSHYALPADALVFGPYTGRLANEGERVTLLNELSGEELVSFQYADTGLWPLAADGAGHSLVPLTIASDNQALEWLAYPGWWRASAEPGGSPLDADPLPMETVQLSEFMALADSGQGSDWVELHNPTPNIIRLDGWFLSDSDANLKKFRLPEVELQPYSRLVLDEEGGFGADSASAFGIGKDADELYLSHSPEGGPARVVDAVRFAAQENDLTYGRIDDEPYWGSMAPTRDADNGSAIERVVIDEIMFNPSPLQDERAFGIAEYIEIVNGTESDIPLWNERGPWRLRGGADFDFPSNLTLPAGGRLLIVPFDPGDTAAREGFRNAYMQAFEQSSDAIFAGPYEGRLANQSERIRLEKPQPNARPDEQTAWIVVDDVHYFDRHPWPLEADGEGLSLQRLSAAKAGSDPLNWMAQQPTPGGESRNTDISEWSLY